MTSTLGQPQGTGSAFGRCVVSLHGSGAADPNNGLLMDRDWGFPCAQRSQVSLLADFPEQHDHARQVDDGEYDVKTLGAFFRSTFGGGTGSAFGQPSSTSTNPFGGGSFGGSTFGGNTGGGGLFSSNQPSQSPFGTSGASAFGQVTRGGGIERVSFVPGQRARPRTSTAPILKAIVAIGTFSVYHYSTCHLFPRSQRLGPPQVPHPPTQRLRTRATPT